MCYFVFFFSSVCQYLAIHVEDFNVLLSACARLVWWFAYIPSVSMFECLSVVVTKSIGTLDSVVPF